MDQAKNLQNQTIDTFLAILVLWTLLANVYTNVVAPFLDTASTEKAFTMINALLTYPFFSMVNCLDDLYLVLFGARFYLKLKRHYRSTTATWIFILVLLLDSMFIFLPYYALFLIFTRPRGYYIVVHVCLTIFYLGNYLPFRGIETYSFSWLPALLFQCQLVMTILYGFAAKQETSLVNGIFVAMAISLTLYLIETAVCYFGFRFDIDIFMPLVFHNPLCVFHIFALGFITCYMTDVNRHSYLKLNHHGKSELPNTGRIRSTHSIVSTSTRELEAAKVKSCSHEHDIVFQHDVITSLQRQESVNPHDNSSDTPLGDSRDGAASVTPKNEVVIVQPTKKRRSCLCKKQKPMTRLYSPSLLSPVNGYQDCQAGIMPLITSVDTAMRYVVAPKKHRQCCHFLYGKVTKEEHRWISSILYSLMTKRKDLGDLFSILALATIYSSLAALGHRTGIVYDQVPDSITLQLKSVPNVGSYFLLLTVRIVIPIMMCIALYYILIYSTIILEWLMQRILFTWLGRSTLPILYTQAMSINFITTNIGAIKVGPYSQSIFFLYLLGGMCVCIMLGISIHTLIEEPVQSTMIKIWQAFERYKAFLVAKQYRRKLNGEL